MLGKVLPESTGGLVSIELSPERAGCETCATRGFCRLPDNDRIEVPADRLPPGVGPGDSVDVELPPAFRLRLAFTVFVLPLLLLLAGAWLGSRKGEGWALGLGFGGLALGLLVAVVLARRPAAVRRIQITRC